jgi:phosphinothricin acetyltransferase
VSGIRAAAPADARAIQSIYAPIVRETHFSFEIEPPSVEEIRRRMESAPVRWIVHEDGAILGFASGGPFRERAAYRWTAEASVYVAEAARGRGVGRDLGVAILDSLRSAGYHSAVGVVALPNAASEGLLLALGYLRVGVIREAGFKLGRWWDVALWQRDLGG